MKKRFTQFITRAALLILALVFLIKFGGASLLKAYLQIGLGNCQKIPVLCLSADTEITNPAIDQSFKSQLIPYKFPKMKICLPKGFNVIQEEMKEFYYTRGVRKYAGPAIYLLYQNPGFFMQLFPQLTKQGIMTNYVFISRLMHTRTAKVENFNDAFFAIMKSIFTPNLGDQKDVKIVKFFMPEYKGYITYNLQDSENYFDCNITDNEDGFFKIYIKDKEKELALNKVFAIISTAQKQ